MQSENSKIQGNELEELDAADLDDVRGGAKMQGLEKAAQSAKDAKLSKSPVKVSGTKDDTGNIILFEEMESI